MTTTISAACPSQDHPERVSLCQLTGQHPARVKTRRRPRKAGKRPPVGWEQMSQRNGRNSRMRMRTLGGTGIKVSPYCLGAMMFGAWGNPDHEESIRIIHAALDAGINFVDTADVYSAGESEEIVGQALRGRRDDVVLATKAHGA